MYPHNPPPLDVPCHTAPLCEGQSVSHTELASLRHLAARAAATAVAATTWRVTEGKGDHDIEAAKVLFAQAILLFEQRHVADPVGNRLITRMLLGYLTRKQRSTVQEQTALCCFLDKLELTSQHLLQTSKKGDATADLTGTGESPPSLADQQDNRGRSLLFLAVNKGEVALVGWLLNTAPSSFSINALFIGKGDDNRSPLHLATENGSEKMVRFLVSQGANVNVSNEYGETPLHLAITSGSLSVIRFLVDSGADVHAADRGGQTALELAAAEDNEDVARFLIDKGVNIRFQGGGSDTPLHRAVAHDAQNVVSLLLKKGVSVDVVNEYGQSPLFYAAETEDEYLIRLLVSYGADLNAMEGDGETCLHLAVLAEEPGRIIPLLNAGANVNARNYRRETPLHLATRLSSEETIRLLIDSGANVNARNYDGETCLHLAAQRGDRRVISLLVNWGADVKALNKKGESPLHEDHKIRPCSSAKKRKLESCSDSQASD